MSSEYLVSKRKIGNRPAVEHSENSEDLKLFGKAGYITQISPSRFRVVITLKTYKLAVPNFSDLFNSEQVLYVGLSGVSAMADYLKVPLDPAKQLKYAT